MGQESSVTFHWWENSGLELPKNTLPVRGEDWLGIYFFECFSPDEVSNPVLIALIKKKKKVIYKAFPKFCKLNEKF